ncbi:CelD/BcsL family acetyltransferase involved in cellulose biosynthesis [Kitasatospora sp. MAA4]|uniref:GNAT family N-acetyltransferase n=1 Tax=Kitasatospora sp. MAA4 TaxID=3035093 RepID=UPI002476A095|nr:GNAT family N-acetyltransferase [Kitasatospora sp. MAA4]MDH6132174.1 CelD/BcsL family acetyltransferase involved in cellulose biosynthesis [Kitasatospora sp. MAA4]
MRIGPGSVDLGIAGPDRAVPALPGLPGELTIRRVTTFDALEELLIPWRELYERSGSRNPYAAPEWLLTWARHFVAERELDVLAVFRRRHLVGVAPGYRRRLGAGLRTVQLLGAGRHDELTELPGVLAEPADSRAVLRAVVGDWCARQSGWDWLDLPLSADQGWFEPEWLTGEVARAGLVRHKTTRPSVVLALPSEARDLRHSLKRNVRESLRSARSRLDRSGRRWAVTAHQGEPQLRAALPELARLHAARAALPGRRRHTDVLASAAHRAFLAEVLPLMARAGRAAILTLDVEDRPVAAQLVLSAPRADYLGISGVDPAWWHASPVTLLHLAAAERAAEHGRGELNLSLGPDVAKLRWSEQVVQQPEFTVCGPRLRSRGGYTAYAAAAAVAGVRREAVRHRIRKDATGGGTP